MTITVYPSKWRGIADAIPSKSDAHRKLIAAALSQNPCTCELFEPFCDDVSTTISALQSLGALLRLSENGLLIEPIFYTSIPSSPVLNCRESGSSLRLLLPVATALCKSVKFTGSGRLPSRPISDLVSQLSEHGVRFSSQTLPFVTNGQMNSGDYYLSGNVSSQYVSGLLFALAFLQKGGRVFLISSLESSQYVDWTCKVLTEFGAMISKEMLDFPAYTVVANRPLIAPQYITVDGDWSNAGVLLCAGALGDSVSVTGLSDFGMQGDARIYDILRACGAHTSFSKDCVTVSCGTITKMDVDMREIPDLLPILSILATQANGISHFTNARRLRLKESDRLASIEKMICDLGGYAAQTDDGLMVEGHPLHGGTVDGFGDHRIVMAAALASNCCDSPITILGAEAISKSYPSFFQQIRALQCVWKAE